MQHILIIEPSATLSHAVKRMLYTHGYQTSTTASYKATAQNLSKRNQSKNYSAVIFGFPPHNKSQAGELLSLLKNQDYRNLPVLILAHAADPDILNWVARRDRTALLLWDDHTDCVDCLKKLLLTPETPSAPLSSPFTDAIRVLFVDDSRTVRVSYKRRLSKHGYLVETANNAAEAMEKARQASFDIAIVDYFMPGGNGDVLCRQLRDDPRTAGITTAIITGTYLDDVIKDSLGAGAIECMFKNEAHELFLARLAAMSRSIQIRKSIEAERQRLESILSSVGDGVYGVNSSGQITFINPAAREILGFDDEDPLIGRSAHKIFHYALEDGKSNPPETCFLQQAYATGDELHSLETVFWKKSGTAAPVECTVFPLRIDNHLEGSVIAFRDVAERKLLEKELLWQANHDPLTELTNRYCFERHLDNEVRRAKRSMEKSALLYIDLDRFKYINDTAGHAAGDQLLVELSQQLQSRLRESDTLARLGGDEFAIILHNIDEDTVLTAADGFREVLEEYNFVYNSRTYSINGSIGVALINKKSRSPGEVLSNADIACHIAKGRGRNQVHLYSPKNDEKVAMNIELGWSTRLQEALKNGGFVLHYQPIALINELNTIDMPSKDGELWHQLINGPLDTPTQYEVLIRLEDSLGGIIPPNAFLPTAERFGLMPQIDVWVLTRALEELATLNTQGRNITFTINISGKTLDPHTLISVLKPLLAKYRLDPGSIIFEITETSAVENIDAAKRLIHDLREIGCRFALDDFGSGFSSFYHLKHLPVDFIKIDGQFVQGMATDSTDHAIVTSINDIAHSFGKRTIAESVENPAILSMLQACGVDYAQGYYISSPCSELPAMVVDNVGAARSR